MILDGMLKSLPHAPHPIPSTWLPHFLSIVKTRWSAYYSLWLTSIWNKSHAFWQERLSLFRQRRERERELDIRKSSVRPSFYWSSNKQKEESKEDQLDKNLRQYQPLFCFDWSADSQECLWCFPMLEWLNIILVCGFKSNRVFHSLVYWVSLVLPMTPTTSKSLLKSVEMVLHLPHKHFFFTSW
jgi:hypothetical protein